MYLHELTPKQRLYTLAIQVLHQKSLQLDREYLAYSAKAISRMAGDTNHRAAYAVLNEMYDRGYLQKIWIGRNTYYALHDQDYWNLDSLAHNAAWREATIRTQPQFEDEAKVS